MEKEWNVSEVMRHARHDWLNRIMLIKGNLDLNKIDGAKSVIDQIISESQNEAMLGNLHMPLFSELMLTGNWNSHPFKLEYEVLEADGPCPDLDGPAAAWTREFFRELKSDLEPFSENNLTVSIYKADKNIRFLYEVQGNITSVEKMGKFIERTRITGLEAILLKIGRKELAIELKGSF
ncbi:Spo0B C-terminal domain-containing protein [Peribacillus sp. SCS-37]|uniref:Spo0B C-terminal domain-containing protein n=1 Tax=Paraperibacillus esterisolvens TaxID=3115296 RepID=UPI003905C499